MSRLFAFLAAVVMVVGAIAIRARIDNPRGGGTSLSAPLICATELVEVCRTLERNEGVTITIEPAGATAARLKAADAAQPPLGGWLVPQPWPRLVDDERRRAALPPLFDDGAKVVARSPLVIVAWKDRVGALASFCGGTVGYRCIGDAALKGTWAAVRGNPAWGDVKPFHADPTREASGVLALAAETLAFHGRSDVAAADLDEDAYVAWLSALARAMPDDFGAAASNAVQDLLTKGPAAYDAVTAIEAQAAPAVASSARRGDLQVIYPAPVVTADVVIARPTGADDNVARLVTKGETKKVFAALGWHVDDFVPVAGVRNQALPPTDGLPSDGLVVALLAKWAEVNR